MKACIRQDASRSRGSAIIAVDGAAPFEGNPSYIIESSDGLYLTPTGWASVKTPITAADGDYIYSCGDGTLNISIGPDVLNKLDSLSAYRISVNGEAPVPLRVPEELSLGLMQEASGVAGDIPKAAPEPKPEPQPAPDPEPEPEPEPEPAPAQEEPVPDLNLGTEVPEKKRSLLVPIIAVLVLLGLAGAAAWYFLGRGEKTAEAPVPAQNETQPAQNATIPVQSGTEPPAAEKPAAEPPAEEAKPGASGADTAPAENAPFLSRARGMLKKGVAPEEALREAKAMRTEKASSDDNDGAFLLLEDAAGNGNAEAMYLYAQFYDPTCTRPRGTIEPDMAQAHDWYKKALDAGYSGAAQDLERLKAAVAEKAKSGDAEAGRLLRAW